VLSVRVAALARKRHTASVVAFDAATCRIIEQSEFDHLSSDHPAAALRAITAALATRQPAAWLLTEGRAIVEDATSVVSVGL
jgi:hypothetical protein